MKKLPMILLLIVPYATLIICYQMDLDMTLGLCLYGALLLFNLVYAFVLPKLGYNGRQLLFWNLLLKLCNIPLATLILLVTLVTMMVGGEGLRDELPNMLAIALLAYILVQLSSAVFGISGFRWCRKYGTLSKAGMVASSIVQLIPGVDVIGSILCYIMFRKEGQNITGGNS